MRDVTLPVRQGEVLALIGASGSGKTTLLRSLNRLTEITAGRRAQRADHARRQEIYELEVNDLRRRVSMVFQQPNPFPMSIFDNVAYALAEQRPPRRGAGAGARRELEHAPSRTRCGGPGCTRRSAGDLDRPALRLSGGQQQRLCIARALAARARGAAAGRAVLGARPDLDGDDRGADRGPARERGDRDRHAQPAAGVPRGRPRRLHAPRRARRVRHRASRCSTAPRSSARATTSAGPSGERGAARAVRRSPLARRSRSSALRDLGARRAPKLKSSAQLQRQAKRATLRRAGPVDHPARAPRCRSSSTTLVHGTRRHRGGGDAAQHLRAARCATCRSRSPCKDAAARTRVHEQRRPGWRARSCRCPPRAARRASAGSTTRCRRAGAAARQRARSGRRPRAPGAAPQIGVARRRSQSKTRRTALGAEGTGQQPLAVAQQELVVYAVARRGGQDRRRRPGGAAATGAQARRRRFRVFFVGEPAAARSSQVERAADDARAERRRRRSAPAPRCLSVIPSSTCATVSHASTAASSDSKMSFQRITTIGSMPPANSEATPSRCRRSPSFSRRWISTRCGRELGAGAQAAQRLGDLLAGADEHVGELDRLLHRRLDAVQAELRARPARRGRRCRRARSPARSRRRRRTARARARAPARRWMMSWVMRSPSCSQTLRSCAERRVLGVVDEQVAQQQRRSAARCVRPPRPAPSAWCRRARRRKLIGAGYCIGADAAAARFHDFFTPRSRLCNVLDTRAA